MAKVEQQNESAKKFIPTQVAIHNKAIDYLGLMQMCSNKIKELKKVIVNIDADREILPEFALYEHNELSITAVARHDKQVMVYRWLLSRYLAHLKGLYDEAIYHDTELYPQQQPYERKSVAAA